MRGAGLAAVLLAWALLCTAAADRGKDEMDGPYEDTGLFFFKGEPGAVIMQYTGHGEYSESDPPTYACVGTNDGIASWRTIQRRLEVMSALGIPTEFHVYEGLSHGFGLGTGTVAEGWIDNAVNFWKEQMETD